MLLSIVLKKDCGKHQTFPSKDVGTEIMTKMTPFAERGVTAGFVYQVHVGSCVRNREAPWQTFNWLILLL